MRRRVVAVALLGGALLPGAGLVTESARAAGPTSWRVIEGRALEVGGHDVGYPRLGRRLLARTARPVLLRPVDIARLKVRARPCRGWPVARLLVDGRGVARWHVRGRRYVHLSARVAIPAGPHRIGVALAHPRRTRRCHRALQVRRVELRERVPLGSAVDWPLLNAGGPYQSTFLAHYDSLTPENRMKWQFLEPAPGRYDFAAPDALVAFAQAHGISVHGHTLVFGQQLPAWMVHRPWKPDELDATMRSFISTVVGRYKGRIASWDVVNEPLAPDGSLAPTLFERLIGPDYVAEALQAAHAADPAAKLYINEVGAETPGPKSDGLYALAQRLLAEGVPLDGIGFQFHVGIGPQAPDPAAVQSTLARFASLGLDVAVSELDVRTSPLAAAAPDQQLDDQADVYREVAEACLEQPACQRFTTWGFSDATSWLGPGERALPFDVDYQPKPAWNAIYDVLRVR